MTEAALSPAPTVARPTPIDLIYRNVFKGLLSEGATERIARNQAVWAVDAYKKNKYKAFDCIDRAIKDGRKLFKKKKRGA